MVTYQEQFSSPVALCSRVPTLKLPTILSLTGMLSNFGWSDGIICSIVHYWPERFFVKCDVMSKCRPTLFFRIEGIWNCTQSTLVFIFLLCILHTVIYTVTRDFYCSLHTCKIYLCIAEEKVRWSRVAMKLIHLTTFPWHGTRTPEMNSVLLRVSTMKTGIIKLNFQHHRIKCTRNRPTHQPADAIFQ